MSEAPADTATTQDAETSTEATETTDTVTPDLAAEVEKWQKMARKHEDRAKANSDAAKELERIKREALPEQERLIAEATAKVRAEVLAEVGSSRVQDAIRVATAGRPVDVEALIEGIDPARFLGEDGQPDTAAIGSWVDRITPEPTTTDAGLPAPLDLGQGVRPDQHLALGSDPLMQSLKNTLGIR